MLSAESSQSRCTHATSSEYHRFLENFNLEERIHSALRISENTLSRHLQDYLRTGSQRHNDESSLVHVNSHFTTGGTLLAVGDGGSLPYNPPQCCSPWLTCYLSARYPQNKILSSDIEGDDPRFIFVTRGNELILYGGLFVDCLNSRFVEVRNGKLEDICLENDETFLRLMQIIGENQRWTNRQENPYFINSEHGKAANILLKSIGLTYSTDNLNIRVISAKDAFWEKQIFGIESRSSVDVFRLEDLPEIKSLSYLLARHLTPEIVEELVSNQASLLFQKLPETCYVDICTEGYRQSERGSFRFGIKGFAKSLRSFISPLD